MVSSQHLLVVLPLQGALTLEAALHVMERLERASALETLGAVVTERRKDSTWQILDVPTSAARQVGLAAWSWLIGATLGRPEACGGPEDPSARRAVPGMSESFLTEVRDLIPPGGRGLAMVSSHLDTDAAVAELRGFPGARLVYGLLPAPIVEHMRGAASSDARSVS